MKTKIIILLLVIHPLILFAQITHSVAFKDIQLKESQLNQDYLEIICDGLSKSGEQEGFPALPSKLILLSVPLGSQIESVEIVNPVIRRISLTKKIVPSQRVIPIKETSEREFVLPLQTVYNSDSPYPEEQIRIAGVNYFDYTNQIVSLEVIHKQMKCKGE
jgi:hypothetical protein